LGKGAEFHQFRFLAGSVKVFASCLGLFIEKIGPKTPFFRTALIGFECIAEKFGSDSIVGVV
jgi:hypothetical protein